MAELARKKVATWTVWRARGGKVGLAPPNQIKSRAVRTQMSKNMCHWIQIVLV